MTASPIILENFDFGTEPNQIESVDYHRGVEDGIAEANASIELQRAKAISDLNATLSDLAFGYEEARQQMLSKITPLMMQISSHIVPDILENTFQQHLFETLKGAIEIECASDFKILVSPENAQLFDDSDVGEQLTYDILPDANLTGGQAIISCGEASQILDLTALTHTLQTALQSFDLSDRDEMNG